MSCRLGKDCSRFLCLLSGAELDVRHCRAHGRYANGLRVAPAATALHVGEVVAKRGDADVGEALGNGLQRPMAHIRAGTMP